MLFNLIKDIEQCIVLHFPNCVYVLKNEYMSFSSLVKQNLVSGLKIIGLVGPQVGGWLVNVLEGNWSVVVQSMIGRVMVSEFNKTQFTVSFGCICLFCELYFMLLLIYLQVGNNFQNILRLLDVFLNFSFTASKTMHDYYLLLLLIYFSLAYDMQ